MMLVSTLDDDNTCPDDDDEEEDRVARRQIDAVIKSIKGGIASTRARCVAVLRVASRGKTVVTRRPRA